MDMIKSLLKTISPIQVAQYFVHVSEHDVDKLRIAALKVLHELVEEYCKDSELFNIVVRK
jgi:hypothetical protein